MGAPSRNPGTIYVSECVIAELETLGIKYRLTLQTARDPRFERLPCVHKGKYADDCIVNRVTRDRIYIVATIDKGLKKRLRAIPGVPIMYLSKNQFQIERLPEKSIMQ